MPELQAYQDMWQNLGLNMKMHDGMVIGLGKIHGKVIAGQVNRPQAMDYFDHMITEMHGYRIKELVDARAAGKKIVGAFCVYVPEELVAAVDGIQVALCAGADVGRDQAEKYLPRTTCALIKAFVGFKLAKVSPYTEVCDLVVGETTCDGKKKIYETFGQFVPMYVMEIPQAKNAADRDLFKQEVLRFKNTLEDLTGVEITGERLREGIRVINNRRIALQRLNNLRRTIPSPISGKDALLVNQAAFIDDPVRITEKVNALCDELENRVKTGSGVSPEHPRILLSGCPMVAPNWKVPNLIESAGAVIVGEESCVGERNTRDPVDETGTTIDEMIDALVDRYMKIDCACFTPNTERLNNISDMVRNLKVDGVIHYSLSFCQPYEIEAFKLERHFNNMGIPFYNITTDYSMEDAGQLKTRIEAFLEMLR